jgi:hypothetical protein
VGLQNLKNRNLLCFNFETKTPSISCRLEIVNLRNPRGIAKIVGTLLSLAGVLTITLYKGPEVQSLQGAPIHIKSNASQQNWVKGTILLVVSCITWSLWFIMQV